MFWTQSGGLIKAVVTYEYGTVHNIVNTSSVVHVTFSPSTDHDPDADPFPAILPMIGVMASYEDQSASLNQPLDLYLHGYVTSRLMKLGASYTGEGLPISIAATKIDGIVLALTPNNHSLNYRSAILQGYASPVTDIAEKVWAMEQITNNVLPKRYEHTRVPPDKTEMTSTQILKVKIASASAKRRQGGPHDERKDLKRDDIREQVWVGVIPIHEQLGEPIPGDENRVSKVPEHVSIFVASENKARKEIALEAVEEPEKWLNCEFVIVKCSVCERRHVLVLSGFDIEIDSLQHY